MNERRYYLAIGTFVLSGFIALLFLAFRMSGGVALFSKESVYYVDAEFTNIGRLKKQSKVALSGVTIGRVIDIQLDRNTFEAVVRMEIFSKYNHIPDDSRFGIVTAGLLGDNYVISYPGFSGSFLENGTIIDTSQTTSALVLEELVSKIMTSFSSTPKSSSPSSQELSI
jgi:phospholipid/cholesterol/gamma-HCH transport system substrate-binding protein